MDRPMRLGAFALVAILFVLPVVTHGQLPISEEGPIFGGETKRPLFSFDHWEGELSLEYLGTRQDTKSTQFREMATENLFTEELTLSTHGAIIHPNLVEFDASGTLDLRQRDFNSTS